MFRSSLFFCVFLSVITFSMPVPAAEEGGFMFFGVVTVRDGATVLIQNPELSEQQVAACAALLEGKLELDRTFTTSKDAKGELRYTWGDEEDTLLKEGLVPYVAYFVTPGLFIQFKCKDITVTPYEAKMGFSTWSTSDVATAGWWAPETTETCDIAMKYYDDSSYKTVVKLEGDNIAVGASGTSPDGVSWKIASIEEKEDRAIVNVETDKGPEGHRFTFQTVTTNWEKPQDHSPWIEDTEDGKGLLYPVSRWVESNEKLVSFEIRERHPDRMKQWEVKGFPLTPKQ